MKVEELTITSEGYAVQATQRPDGSILLKFISSDGKTIERVAGKITDIGEAVRAVKFDIAYEAGNSCLHDAVKYCSSTAGLPTYMRTPLFRTHSSRLWSTRKLRE